MAVDTTTIAAPLPKVGVGVKSKKRVERMPDTIIEREVTNTCVHVCVRGWVQGWVGAAEGIRM